MTEYKVTRKTFKKEECYVDANSEEETQEIAESGSVDWTNMTNERNGEDEEYEVEEA